MKKLLYILLSLVTLVGCRKDLDLNKGETALTLTLSTDSIRLIQRYASLQALAISWTSGTNHGTGSAIAYEVELDTVGNNFEGGITWSLGKTDAHNLIFTHKQVQDTILTYFPLMPLEQWGDFEMRVTATIIATGEVQRSPVQPLAVNLYGDRPMDLYMVGDASPNGWDPQLATRLTPDDDTLGLFRYEGKLKHGEFKLLTVPGLWFPCYVRDEATADSTAMILRGTEDDCPDLKWEINKTADYRVTVNTDSLTISIVQIGGEYIEPVYYHIWMIGDATAGGWSWDAITEMSIDTEDFNHFYYEGHLSSGELKFPIEQRPDWGGQFIMAPVEHCVPSAEAETYLVQNQPDQKWDIPTTGTWRIDIHADLKTITFQFLD